MKKRVKFITVLCLAIMWSSAVPAAVKKIQPGAVPATQKKMQVMGNFDIPRHSFNFANSWKSDFAVTLPIFGKVLLGRSGYGLCGGMVYAAHDSFWHESTSGLTTNSPDRKGGYKDVPPKGNRLRQYIWDRQMDSLKREGWFSVQKLAYWLGKTIPYVEKMSKREFDKKIRPGIDRGWAIPLMIVVSPAFTKNHQVLAIGYEWHSANREWDIIVYDPNVPDLEAILHTGIKKIKPRYQYPAYEIAFRGYFVTKYKGQRPWWGPGASKGPWQPGTDEDGGLRDPFGTGGKGPDKPKVETDDPSKL